MGKKGKNNSSNHRSNQNPNYHGGHGHGARRQQDIEQSNAEHQHEKKQFEKNEEDVEDGGEEEEEDEGEILASTSISVRIFLWEFGQNDPKRDSGSKMCRFGFAKKLRIGQSFNGIVLSSEAEHFMSPADHDIVRDYGIAGINCSWNRLEEIPFNAMGKSQHQRKLPLLVAANSVNYGKPYKMNTAEAIAAGLYIAGFQTDAISLLYPFSFGPEFLKLNAEALSAYCKCTSEEEILSIMNSYLEDAKTTKAEKDNRKAIQKATGGKTGSYLDESDLPPMDSEDEYEYEEEGEDNKEEALK